jgi:hypothetical protein
MMNLCGGAAAYAEAAMNRSQKDLRFGWLQEEISKSPQIKDLRQFVGTDAEQLEQRIAALRR